MMSRMKAAGSTHTHTLAVSRTARHSTARPDISRYCCLRWWQDRTAAAAAAGCRQRHCRNIQLWQLPQAGCVAAVRYEAAGSATKQNPSFDTCLDECTAWLRQWHTTNVPVVWLCATPKQDTRRHAGTQPLVAGDTCRMSAASVTTSEAHARGASIPAPGFAALPKLRRLCLTRMDIDPAVLAAVSGLQHLRLCNCGIRYDLDCSNEDGQQQRSQAHVAFFSWLSCSH